MKKLFLLFIIASLFESCGGNSDATTEPENPNEIKPDTPVVVREIVGIARIEPPEKIITLNAESGGYVREVRFQENQLVKKGDILIVLDGEVEQAQLQQARSKIQSQKDAVTAAKATLESLKVKLANARNTYDRNQRRYPAAGGRQSLQRRRH
jgi:multidrug efflux pump subunit AcrA (membrane-fusion protein)